MRLHAATILLLTACSTSHAPLALFDSGPPAGDAGGLDAGHPDHDAGATADAATPRACEDGLLAERGRCVGWRPAAGLPFDPWGEPDEIAPELVIVLWGGEHLIRHGDALFRYLPAEDRFEEVAPTSVFPADMPSDGLPAVADAEYGRAFGRLEDGTRVLTTVSYYSVAWVAQRDDRGDGVWLPTVPPPDFFQPAIAYPIDERSILFAGRVSGIYVIE